MKVGYVRVSKQEQDEVLSLSLASPRSHALSSQARLARVPKNDAMP